LGHWDNQDYGAGAFPELRLLRGRSAAAARGPTLPYFSHEPGPAGRTPTPAGGKGVGELKLLACADAACTSASAVVSELASGAAGFGRDTSLALTRDGTLLVSFLDLMGQDDRPPW
jgi:hypothetical protein